MTGSSDRHCIFWNDGSGSVRPAETVHESLSLFEMPVQLRAHHAELYKQLQGFYHRDPA